MRAGLGTQLGAPVRALAAVARVPRGALGLLFLYTLACAAAFAATGWAMTAGRPALEAAVLGYILPDDWLPYARPLLRGLASGQSNTIFVNATLMTGIAVAASLLFRLKERLSQAFERGQPWAPAEPENELPLWFQIFEEVRIFLLYLSLQLTFFWIGLSPDPTRKAAATALSTAFLWVQLALDFGSPGLQRRGRRYADIARLCLRRPLAMLLFGALFTAPAQLAGHLLAPHASETPALALAGLFGVATVTLPLAVLGGTRLAAELLPLPVEPLRGLRRVAGHLAVWLVVAVNLASAGLALRTLHHMSQVLKCEYAVVPDTWRVRTSLLDPIVTGQVHVAASVEMDVRNPTPFDLDLKALRLEIRHQDDLLAEPSLSGLVVPSGERRRHRVELKLPLETATLAKGFDLLDPGWTIRLRLSVLPGTELPLDLLRASP